MFVSHRKQPIPVGIIPLTLSSRFNPFQTAQYLVRTLGSSDKLFGFTRREATTTKRIETIRHQTADSSLHWRI